MSPYKRNISQIKALSSHDPIPLYIFMWKYDIKKSVCYLTLNNNIIDVWEIKRRKGEYINEIFEVNKKELSDGLFVDLKNCRDIGCRTNKIKQIPKDRILISLDLISEAGIRIPYESNLTKPEEREIIGKLVKNYKEHINGCYRINVNSGLKRFIV